MIGRRPSPLMQLTTRILPFSDAASEGLPMGQLLRLSLFQVSVGMATVMLLGTLNRVMIVELSVPATIVAVMIALPVLIAPFRTLLGFRSDTHRSAIGWKRIPISAEPEIGDTLSAPSAGSVSPISGSAHCGRWAGLR